MTCWRAAGAHGHRQTSSTPPGGQVARRSDAAGGASPDRATGARPDRIVGVIGAAGDRRSPPALSSTRWPTASVAQRHGSSRGPSVASASRSSPPRSCRAGPPSPDGRGRPCRPVETLPEGPQVLAAAIRDLGFAGTGRRAAGNPCPSAGLNAGPRPLVALTSRDQLRPPPTRRPGPTDSPSDTSFRPPGQATTAHGKPRPLVPARRALLGATPTDAFDVRESSTHGVDHPDASRRTRA